MLRFRAGGVTDDRGIRFAGAPYHIPWVWVEFLLTSIGNGSVRLRGAASIFPTIAWYLNDRQVRPPHPQTTDTSFPRSFWTGKVAEKELRIWPVLACGIPRSLPLPPPSSDAAFAGKRIPIKYLPWDGVCRRARRSLSHYLMLSEGTTPERSNNDITE